MGKLSNVLWNTVSEVSVIVGPKTTTKAIRSIGNAVGYAEEKAGQFIDSRKDRKQLFNKLNKR